MRYRELWKLCEECVETYDLLPKNACCTFDEHIEDILSSQVDIEPEEIVFVKEAAGGVFRYRRFAELALTAYCDGMHRNRQDYVAMYLIAYLLVYRYDEIGGVPFRQLIHKSTANNRIAEFIQFLLSSEMLEAHAIPRWRTCYDDGYVDKVIVGSLMRNKPDIEANVLSWYLEKATSIATGSGGAGMALNAADLGTTGASQPTIRLRAQLTQPKSPQFSSKKQQQQRAAASSTSHRQDLSLLPPMEVREMLHTKPLPKLPRIADNCTEEERACVEAARRGEKLSTLNPVVKTQNRRREKEIPFHEFNAVERPSDMPRLLKEKTEREQAEVAQLQLNRPSPTRVRQQLQAIATTVDVRTTNAALRREDIVYRRRLEEEEEELRRKEQALRDDSEYWAWRNKEEQRERVERETRIAQRKIDMMLADEEARAVRLKQQKRNQSISRQFRAENAHWREQFEREEQARVEEQRRRAIELRDELKQDADEALARLQREKQQIVAEVKTQKQRDEMKVAMAFELERERKQQLIKEIKAVHERSIKIREEERERKRHVRPVDVGQLVTMTYEELQDKLVEVKREQEELTERRREAILRSKDELRREQDEMRARIAQQRQRFRSEKETARTARRETAAEAAERQRAAEEAKIFELQEKLRSKREEREREQQARREEDRQRRLAAQLLAADAGAIEAEKWREMERGAQNTVVLAQNRRLQQNRVDRAIRRGTEALREKNIEATFEQHLSARRATDELLSTKRTIYLADKEHDEEVRKAAYAAMKVERDLMRRGARSA